MTWKKCVLWLSFMFLLGVMLTPLGTISYSATKPTIRVDPLMVFREEPGEHFFINLTIIGGVDVYAWQINMTFDPSIVMIVNGSLPPEHFLEGRPEGTSGLMILKGGHWVLFGCVIQGDYAGMSGSGTLATLEFEVVGTGESSLKFDVNRYGAEYLTYLLDSDLEATNPPKLELKDGYFSNIDHPPTASFTHSPSKPDVNETITFDASASFDPDGYIVRYEWDFGDDTTINETDSTTTHAYTEAQTYTVTLTVIDNATATQKIKDTFNTTTIPHLWYELHSSYSTEIKFKVDHDIVVTTVDASPTTVTVGDPVTINVVVRNDGKETETFDVIAYYDNNTAATTTVENLVSEGEKTLELTWDTTDVAPETYVIKVEAELVGDQHPEDNIKFDGTVTVMLPGTTFPLEYALIAGVAGVAIVIGVFLFVRRRRTPAT